MLCRTTLRIAVAGAFACLAPAQSPSVVSPADALTTTGNSNNTYPFSLGTSTYQQVHSASSFSVAAPRTVSVLRFRPTTFTTASDSVDLLLRMADCPHGASGAQSTFANNTVPGTDTLVFTRKTVNLPMISAHGWNLSFPFDQPFSWAGGHLSWFCEVFGNSNGNMNLRRSCEAWTDSGDVSHTNALGCASALGTAPATLAGRVGAPGGTGRLLAYSFVAAGGLPAVLLFGATPMAVDLTPVGATGCTLTTDVLAALYGVTSPGPNGEVDFNFPIPPDPWLVGVSFRTQAAFAQAGANPLGVFASRGTIDTIGRDFGITRLYGGPGSSFGTVDPRYGLAIALD